MTKRLLYQQIASAIAARNNCKAHDNEEWFNRWTERLEEVAAKNLPSGAGFDLGVKIDLDSSPNRIALLASYHHHGEQGYTHWTNYKVIVTPDLAHGYNLRITGRDHNGFKSYAADVFATALDVPFEWED